MKKTISIFIVFSILIFCLFGCKKNDVVENMTTESNVEQTQLTEASTISPQTSIYDLTENTQEDVGGGDVLPDKYRLCYYHVPYHFTLLVDKEVYEKWFEEVYLVYPNETNQMIIKRFIQDFNISREDFDKANYDRALHFSQYSKEVPIMNPQDYTNQEMWEVYNADIIYTFDDEIINAYYLSHPYPFLYESEYEDAVLSGTYRTQTTDFYFPELDSHSSVELRGYEYPEETTAVTTEPATTILTETTIQKEDTTE